MQQSINKSEFVRLRYPPRRETSSLPKPNCQYLVLLRGYPSPTNLDLFNDAVLKFCCKVISFEYNKAYTLVDLADLYHISG